MLNILIKKANKGITLVNLDCLSEAYGLLTDTTFYKKLLSDPTFVFKKERLMGLFPSGIID